MSGLPFDTTIDTEEDNYENAEGFPAREFALLAIGCVAVLLLIVLAFKP